MMHTATAGTRDQHEAAGGLSWKVSALLNTMVRVGEVYDAVMAQGQLLKAGDMQRFNLATYLRRRSKLRGEPQPDELAQLIRTCIAERPAPPPPARPRVQLGGVPDSAAKARRERMANGSMSVSERERAVWDDGEEQALLRQLEEVRARKRERGALRIAEASAPQ